MRSLARSIFAAAGIALVASLGTVPADAQINPSGQGFLLRIKWQAGKTYAYRMTTSMTMPGGGKPMQIPSDYSMRVMSVANGVATVRLTTSGMAMAGQKAEPVVQTVKMDSRGIVQGAGDANMLQLPAGPVRVGQTWQTKQRQASPTGMGMMELTSTHTFRGVRTENGRRVAAIVSSSKGGGGGMQASGTTTSIVDTSDGMVRSTTGSLTITMRMPASGSNAKPSEIKIPVGVNMVRR